MQERKAITSVPTNELAARCWSSRAFDATQGVTKTQLTALSLCVVVAASQAAKAALNGCAIEG